jgi:hypothetical protein
MLIILLQVSCEIPQIEEWASTEQVHTNQRTSERERACTHSGGNSNGSSVAAPVSETRRPAAGAAATAMMTNECRGTNEHEARAGRTNKCRGGQTSTRRTNERGGYE